MITWENLPKEIQERMFYEQEKQGNLKSASVFIENITSGSDNGGFTWANTVDGHTFWANIFENGEFNEFYEIYPKTIIKPEFFKEFRKVFKVNIIPKKPTTEIMREIEEKGLKHMLYGHDD